MTDTIMNNDIMTECFKINDLPVMISDLGQGDHVLKVEANYEHIDLEICLHKKRVLALVDELFAQLPKSTEAQWLEDWSWDPVGMKQLARSIEQVGVSATNIGDKLDSQASNMQQNVRDFNSIANEIMRKLLPPLKEASEGIHALGVKGLDVNIGFDKLLLLFDEPVACSIVCSIIYLFIEFVDRKFEVKGIQYIKICLGMFMVLKLGSKIVPLIKSWLMPTNEPQSDWGDWLTVGVQGVLFLVFGTTLDFSTVLNAVKSLGLAAGNAIKLGEIFSSIIDWFKGVVQLVCDTFGIELASWMKPVQGQIKDLMDKVNKLMMRYNENPMGVDIHFAEEVTVLFMQVNNFLGQQPINSKNQPVITAIRNLQDKMAILQRNVSDAGMALGERFEPAFIPISGAPGIGKTYLSDFMSQEISFSMCDTEEELVDVQRNWKRNVYAWPTDNKHHDQYKGEKIVVYPDLFCQTDAEGQPSEATSIVYLVGGQPIQLSAAEITKKQKLYFVSQVMLACTNVSFIHDAMFKSVRNADAVKRRLDAFGWFMWVNPIYIKRDGAGRPVVDPNTNRIRGYEHDDEMYAMLDTTLVPEMPAGEMCPDLWFFRRLKFSTGEFADNKVYDYANFSKLYINYISTVRHHGQQKKEALDARSDLLAARVQKNLSGETQSGTIEHTVVPMRPCKKIKSKAVPLYIREQRKLRREERKDAIDSMRELEMRKKYPTFEMESDYETSEEYEDNNKAQMDNEEVFPRVELDRDDLSCIRANRDSVPWMNVTVLNQNLTAEQHAIIREVFTSSAEIVTNSPRVMSEFAMRIAETVSTRSAEHGFRVMVIRNAIRQLEDDERVSDIIKTLKCAYIIQLANMNYAQATVQFKGMMLNSYFKDPFLAMCYEIRSKITSLYEIFLQPTVHFVRDRVLGFIYSPRFRFLLDEALHAMIVSASMMLPMVVGLMIIQSKTKDMQAHTVEKQKEFQNNELNFLRQKKSLVTKEQSSWIAMEGVSKVIDKYMANMCGLYVTIHKPDGTNAVRHPCNLVFLGGKIAVIVDHARQGMIKINEIISRHPGHYMEVSIVPFTTVDKTSCVERFVFDELEFDTNDMLRKNDLAIIKFKHCVNRPHMYHLIPPVACLEWMTDKRNLEGIFIERTTDMDLAFKGPEKRVNVRFGFADSLGSYTSEVNILNETHKVASYEYQTMTMKGTDGLFTTHSGYCSSPGFMIDERKNFCVNMGWKQAQQPWLCYLHTSLQDRVPNGAPVFREMFTKWIDELSSTPLKAPIDAIVENVEAHIDALESGNLIERSDQSCNIEITSKVIKVDQNHQSFAVSNMQFFVPTKSEIKRSPLFGIEPRTRYPARMGIVHTKTEGIVDTMKKAREPYANNGVLLNGPIVDEIIHQAMTRVMTDSSKPINTEILTLDQCLYGDMAYSLNSVNWSSSPGFYLRITKDMFTTDWKQKKWMFNFEEGKLYPHVHAVLNKLFDYYNDKLLNGERIYGLNIDNIKDELLKKEKVLEANSRLFCTNDFIHLLLCKSYMGAFAGWIYTNRIHNGVAIGVNPLSEEWTSIATVLVNNSPKCVFMDHKKFDKDQPRQIMKCVLVLMDMFYQDVGSENARCRELLFEDIIDSVHVCMMEGKMYFYMWHQANTSGNFLTAILNSLVNICYFYICCIFAWLEYNNIDPMLLKVLPKNPADEALRCICLGDDIVGSINNSLMPGVNFNTIKRMGKKYLNINITDELKTEGAVPDFRRIDEGSFLGRTFTPERKDGVLRFIGRLRMYSIIEKVQWIKGVYDPLIEVEKIEGMFLELSNYPEIEFIKRVLLYAPRCKEVYGVYPKYTDYLLARRRLRELAEYRFSFNDFLEGETFEGISVNDILLKFRLDKEKSHYATMPLDNTDKWFSIEQLSETTAVVEPKLPDPENNVSLDLVKNISKRLQLVMSSSEEKFTDDFRNESLPYPTLTDVVNSKEGGIAQMDNKESTDFEKSVIISNDATTTFVDTASVEMGTTSRNTFDVSTYLEHHVDIKSFLKRPALIASGQWTVSQAINSNIARGDIAPLLTSQALWADKIRGFNLIRGDFMIKVNINASPFQQGKLLLHYLPCLTNFVANNPKYERMKNKSLTQKVQHPHVEVDCRKTSVVLRIPYVAPTAWYAMREAYYDWGTWFLDVFSPLNTGAGATNSSVDYLVYAWFENVELNAPMNPQSDNTEVIRKPKRRGGEVSESGENSGPITQGLRKVSAAAGILGEVPILTNFVRPVEWVTNIMSNVTSALGWSKPRELEGQTFIAQQLMRYAGTCDGPDAAYPGGISCLNRLETIDYGSFTNEDEMSLAFLYQIPYYKGEITWDAAAGIGSSLMGQYISPLSILNVDSDTVATHTTTYEYHVPFTYMARMHKFWRGKIIMTLKFIKTQMHSGRIQVTWVPCNLTVNFPNMSTGSYVKRAVIDIRTEDTVSIELPYLLYSDYAGTMAVSPNLSYSGHVDVVVLNDLRAPDSCAQSIKMQVFYSAGDDFELAGPGTITSGNVPYVPQSDGKELIRDSVKQGMELPSIEGGGKSTLVDHLFHAKRCVGEKILSIKSYLLRNSVINYSGGFTLNTANRWAIDPYFLAAGQMNPSTGVLNTSSLCGDHLSHIASWYSFMRGGVRWTIRDILDDAKIVTNTMCTTGLFGSNPAVVNSSKADTAQAVFIGGSDNVYPLTPCNIFDQNKGVYQHVPYYSRLPMMLTSYYNGTDAPTSDPGRPLSTLKFMSNANPSVNTNIQRAVSDDFQLLFFTGCPPLPTSYT